MAQWQFNPLTERLDLVNRDLDLTLTAGATLGGQRVVTLNSQGELIHADHANANHAGRICGLTLTSALPGSLVTVRSFGLLEDPSWHWDTSRPRLFLYSNGTITQSVPASGFLCVLGFCLSETQLFIDIQPAIQLI
jgi:hypothetical protein